MRGIQCALRARLGAKWVALMDSAGAVESKLPTAPWTAPRRAAHTDHSADGHSLIFNLIGTERARSARWKRTSLNCSRCGHL